MSLKNRALLLLIVSGIISAGVIVMLAVAFFNNFPAWSTLTLLACVLAAITGWAFYYVTNQKYKDSIDPKKKKYGSGNRKNRRKS